MLESKVSTIVIRLFVIAAQIGKTRVYCYKCNTLGLFKNYNIKNMAYVIKHRMYLALVVSLTTLLQGSPAESVAHPSWNFNDST